MAGGKSVSQANDYLNFFFTTGTAPTRPTSWTLALFSDATGRSSAPTTELTAGNCPGYSRQAINFSTPSNGSTSNSNDVQFTATGAWTVVANYYAVYDNAGTLKEWCPLSTSRQPQVSGDKIDFAIGSVTLGES
jgi:hypothetical protein